MKFIDGTMPLIELTRRNVEVLLAKLVDPLSERTLISPCGQAAVRIVEDEEHYSDRAPGPMFMPSSGVTL